MWDMTQPADPTARALLPSARAWVEKLTAEGAWEKILSKDVPGEVTAFVLEASKEGRSIDQIRNALGIKTSTDARWRKIMTAIRSGKRVDAVAVFHKWMERNERVGDKLSLLLDEMLENEKPVNKFLLMALSTLSTLQRNTVSIGKDLGVFVDPQEKSSGGQGTTIIVQTNVPSPDPKVIEIHNEKRIQQSKEMIEAHRPKEGS